MAGLSGLNGILNIDSIGAGWQPKASNIRVGRDVAAFTSTTFTGNSSLNTVVGSGDSVSLKSKEIFNLARSAAQNGYSVRQFRSISDEAFKSGGVAANANTIKHGDYSVSVKDGTLTVFKKAEEEGQPPTLVMNTAITDDSRLVWGENGEPQLLTGNAARTKGVLKAQGADEIMLSVTGSDVQAGENSVVWNLTGQTGTYSGGNNVTYLGNYNGGEFTDTKGKVTFGGYFNQSSFSDLSGASEFTGVFDKASVMLEKGHGKFSGYFSASEITGNGTNTMSGMFIDACTIQGGDGDDTFSGRFIDSSIDGGDGNNSFGNGPLNLMRELVGSFSIKDKTYSENYMGVEADFINATVTAGSGKDSVNGVTYGGSFDLGDGDDSIDGIFTKTEFNAGNGNDSLRATYAAGSTFNTGDGDDSVTLQTAMDNAIVTGMGANAIEMGLNEVSPSATTWQSSEEYFNNERPRETGELAKNTIDASLGENAITMHNGETTRKILSGDREALEQEPGKQEAENRDAPAEQVTGGSSAGEGAIPQTGATFQTGATDKATTGATTPADAQEEKNPPASQKAMRTAIGRYREALGMEPLEKGELAATIDFGNGDTESFMSAKREDRRKDHEENGMAQTVRRYNMDGSISWKRWQQLAY